MPCRVAPDAVGGPDEAALEDPVLLVNEPRREGIVLARQERGARLDVRPGCLAPRSARSDQNTRVVAKALELARLLVGPEERPVARDRNIHRRRNGGAVAPQGREPNCPVAAEGKERIP